MVSYGLRVLFENQQGHVMQTCFLHSGIHTLLNTIVDMSWKQVCDLHSLLLFRFSLEIRN